jgi:RNA polymerase sigma-70 factor (ECF subfamily)
VGVEMAQKQTELMRADLMRALHAEYADSLWRYALWLTNDHARAQDVVQETLLRAWRRPQLLDQRTQPAGGWLYTVARNIVIDEQRSARMRKEFLTENPPETSDSDNTEARLDAWMVGDALEQLTPEHRDVVVECYYRGRSTADVAQLMGIPAGTVKSRLHYGLRALRLILQEMGVTR